MNTDTRSCDPTVPVIAAGLEGQDVEPSGTIQTTPDEEACAGTERLAAATIDTTRSRIDVRTIGFLFKKFALPVDWLTKHRA